MLTEEQRRGRAYLLWFLSSVVLISASVITFYVVVVGPGKLPTQLVRFGLTLALCYWVYRGSTVAKWILIVLASLAGWGAKIAAGLVSPLWGILALGLMGYLYLSIVTLLVKSSDVNSFLRHQRGEADPNTEETPEGSHYAPRDEPST